MEPRTAASGGAGRCFELSQKEIIELTGAPKALLFGEVSSTMDVAHAAAAAGAPAGTIVLAERQVSGRGRGGRSWISNPRSGVWLTLIARPGEDVPVELMSLRAGLALAPALDRLSSGPVTLKWPNDLYLDDRKLGGILTEARWRDGKPEWVAIGVGVNLAVPPRTVEASALRAGVTAPEVLAAIVPALTSAARLSGELTPAELTAFASRDAYVGKPCVEPAPGIVRGISATGELLIESSGKITAHRTGSLVLERDG